MEKELTNTIIPNQPPKLPKDFISLPVQIENQKCHFENGWCSTHHDEKGYCNVTGYFPYMARQYRQTKHCYEKGHKVKSFISGLLKATICLPLYLIGGIFVA